ncbi:hypothetical protein EOL73_04620 [Candidatus Saccharibacteria bacterium]|nr:hypothetical protein [Candidatus Saccharibacteria bacterium]NCU41007.1 hypothetical protein [Candidatus Saccharibacteria bacterium]
MARTPGATNEVIAIPAVYTLSAEQRLQMLVALLVEIIAEEEA